MPVGVGLNALLAETQDRMYTRVPGRAVALAIVGVRCGCLKLRMRR